MPNTPTGALGPDPGHGPGPGPRDTASDSVPPEEQLYFTRAEKKRIQSRLLMGSGAFQAVALALVIVVNVGGVREVGGHVFAEDAYIFTVRFLSSLLLLWHAPHRGTFMRHGCRREHGPANDERVAALCAYSGANGMS